MQDRYKDVRKNTDNLSLRHYKEETVYKEIMPILFNLHIQLERIIQYLYYLNPFYYLSINVNIKITRPNILFDKLFTY